MRRAIGVLGVLAALLCAASASATVLPPGFTETTVLRDLGVPTAFRFAADGRVLVAAKDGLITVYDSVDDPAPTVYADLRARVHNYWDRGLLGMTLDPRFTSGRPYVYVLYAYDKPGWGDDCPSPPGPTEDGCVISGRLSRLDPDGRETVLIEDWCQQYPSHSVGTVEFGPDGQLYVSGGEGASFLWTDWGQVGNPCGDPPGTPLLPTTSEGGSLRAQSFDRRAGEPVALGGALLRVNPDTGAASAGNPAIADADPNRRRIIAYGFRNPFRFTFRPGTRELWVGDVGADTTEEIDRVPALAQVPNFGWPCYEGARRHWAFGGMGNATCDALYARGDMAAPYFAYDHGEPVVPGEACPAAQGSVSGLAFYTGDQFPAEYADALFFSDFARNCIWVAYPGVDELPDMRHLETFASDAANPVSLTQGPDGALYYADLAEGAIRQIAAHDHRPTAKIVATPTAGLAPLTVAFDGRGSSDPEQQPLTYAWDLDGDGAYDDSSSPTPTRTYTTAATVTVRLRVTDRAHQSDTSTQTIRVGAPPTVATTAPSVFTVGERIAFSGSARTSAGDPLPASALTWALALRHCARTDVTACHTHPVQTWSGTASGSFVAPDHGYPSHLELSLTARDEAGLVTSQVKRIDARTAELLVTSDPPVLEVTLGEERLTTPFTRTVIAHSQTSISTPVAQGVYRFAGWEGAVSAAGTVTAPDSGSATVVARFTGGPEPTPTPPTVVPCAAPCGPPLTVPEVGGLPAAPKLLGAWGFEDRASARTTGRHGRALALTGRNRLTVRAPGLSAFTLEAWLRVTRAGTIAQRGSAFRLSTKDGRVPRGRWAHVAVTYDGTTVRVYRNGRRLRAQRRTVPRSTSVIRLGAFTGRLDDVRLYDGAVPAARITRDMRTAVR